MDFSEYAEWLAAAVGSAVAGIIMAIYRRVSIRPAIDDLAARMEELEKQVTEIASLCRENAVRLEERRENHP